MTVTKLLNTGCVSGAKGLFSFARESKQGHHRQPCDYHDKLVEKFEHCLFAKLLENGCDHLDCNTHYDFKCLKLCVMDLDTFIHHYLFPCQHPKEILSSSFFLQSRPLLSVLVEVGPVEKHRGFPLRSTIWGTFEQTLNLFSVFDDACLNFTLENYGPTK